MSTDWSVVCTRCKVGCHIGQAMAATPSFGYGSKDIEGSNEAAAFVNAHIYCKPHLQIMVADAVPDEIRYYDYGRVEEHGRRICEPHIKDWPGQPCDDFGYILGALPGELE